jgi:hypothetical protein
VDVEVTSFFLTWNNILRNRNILEDNIWKYGKRNGTRFENKKILKIGLGRLPHNEFLTIRAGPPGKQIDQQISFTNLPNRCGSFLIYFNLILY